MPRQAVDTPLVPLDGVQQYLRNKAVPKAMRSPSGSKRNWFRIENSADSDDAEVYIYDEIGFWGKSAQDFVDELKDLKGKNLKLHINSPGGEYFDGVAIYNALKTHGSPIDVHVDGLAASAASFIAQAGDKITMHRGSTMMIHDASGICFGNAKDMRDVAHVLDKISNSIADIYALRAGQDIHFWRALMEEEVWYTAQEAVDVNLADEVSETPVEDPDKELEDRWALSSVFCYAGRDHAPSPQSVYKKVWNRVKENPVSPKNQTEEKPGTGTETPETQPTEQQPPEQPPEPTDEQKPPEEQPPGQTEEPQPTNKAGDVLFMCNGKPVSDPKKVQAHITALEGAAHDQQVVNRKNFIKSLSDSKKILASQVPALEAFVLGDDNNPGLNNKQYEMWAASWDAAPGLGVLAQGVADGITNPDGTPKDDDEIEVALEIVRQNKRGNMPQAQLEKTPSYQKLVAANALDRL